MSRFPVRYRAPVGAREQTAKASPEQAKAGLEAWMTWAGQAGGAIVDLGAPLREPFVLGTGAGDEVAGFSIIEADSSDAALEVLRDHRHLHMSGTIEARELLQLPSM